MAASNRSARATNAARASRAERALRCVGSALVALLGPAVVPGAMLAQAPASPGLATYETFALSSGTQRLCPGEQLQFWAGVNQVTTRTGGTGVVHVSRSVPYSLVTGTVANPSIGTLRPSFISTGAAQSPRGGFTAPMVFTAQQVGQTNIDFQGRTFPNVNIPVQQAGGGPVTAAPQSVSVEVACTYSISLFSTWSLPGERVLDVIGAVSTMVTPGANGRFSTVATMSSSAVWIGGCPGNSRIQRSRVTIFGELVAPVGLNSGHLAIKVVYDPVSSTTTEGCVGKSRSDRGQADPLDLQVDPAGAVLNPTHVLRTYVDAVGSTTVVVKKLTP
jgi:hypothetical protein